jgi:hypothetical protein
LSSLWFKFKITVRNGRTMPIDAEIAARRRFDLTRNFARRGNDVP